MYTLDITEAAEQDLDRITDYLGITLANPQAALALLDEVEKINAELMSNPSIYPLCAAANLADLGYHKAIAKSFHPYKHWAILISLVGTHFRS